MYDNEIAKMERDLADLKKLQAKITPQVEAKIKELTKDGFLPHEIARVMKLDRKIVSTVAKTPKSKNVKTPKTSGYVKLTYLQNLEREHQGFNRQQKDSWIKIGKPRHDKLKQCPCCRKYFNNPDRTYPETEDGQKAYWKSIKKYNEETYFTNENGNVVYPEYDKKDVKKIPNTQPVIEESSGVPNIPTNIENLSEEQQNFVAMKTDVEQAKTMITQAETTPKKNWLQRQLDERERKKQKNRRNKVRKQVTKLENAETVNQEKLDKARKELASLDNKED